MNKDARSKSARSTSAPETAGPIELPRVKVSVYKLPSKLWVLSVSAKPFALRNK